MSLLLRSTLILAATLLALAGVGVLKARAAPATAGIGNAGGNPARSIVGPEKNLTMRAY